MMPPAEARELLERWNLLLHEHGAELHELKAAGVSEARIAALYPLAGHAAYTKGLQALMNGRSFAKLHRRFKADRALLVAPGSGWSVWWNSEEDNPSPQEQRTLGIGTAETGELVDALHKSHPRHFKRWPRSAHEFASAFYILPVLLQLHAEHEVTEVYRYARGQKPTVCGITEKQFRSGVELVLRHAQRG